MSSIVSSSNLPAPTHRVAGRLAAATLLLLVLALLTAGAAAQDASPPGDATTGADEPALTASDQTIEVETPTADAEIVDRLRRILVATGRFTDPGVDVKDGVVFLSGRTRDEEHREWAGDLARKTEGVVAIINNIVVEEGSVWSLEPAAREMRTLWREIVQALPLIMAGLVVLIVTMLVAGVIVRGSGRQLEKRVKSALVRNVVEKLLLVAIALVGVYLFLRVSGLTRIAVTLAGGTGLVGLVIGFAFRDIAENFLASILISMQRPFRIGDTVEVDGHTGVVQKVTTRGTVLMDFDGNHIQIANSTVYKNTICNLTANPNIRIGFVIGVGYDSSITHAQQLALDVLREHSAVLDTPEPSVLVETLGAASISIRVYFWIDGHEHSKAKVRSSLMRLIVRAYEKAGISLPDEAREVIFPKPVEVRMLAGIEGDGATPAPREKPSASEDGREATEAEGDLKSEVADIQRQADDARIPEEGADILEGDDDEEPRAAS